MASEENTLEEAVELFLGRAGATFLSWRLEALVSVCVLGGKWQGWGVGMKGKERDGKEIGLFREKKNNMKNWELRGNSKSLFAHD